MTKKLIILAVVLVAGIALEMAIPSQSLARRSNYGIAADISDASEISAKIFLQPDLEKNPAGPVVKHSFRYNFPSFFKAIGKHLQQADITLNRPRFILFHSFLFYFKAVSQ